MREMSLSEKILYLHVSAKVEKILRPMNLTKVLPTNIKTYIAFHAKKQLLASSK